MNTDKTQEVPLLTAQELASQLRCSLAAVRMWTRQGMPCHKYGRLARYERRAIEAWFEKRSGHSSENTGRAERPQIQA